MARNATAYDEDFYAWATEQAGLLRAGDTSQIDAENIAEELESMGRSTRRELRNRLVVLLTHLLKWRCQPGFRSRSWSATVREQRQEISELLSESPSLAPLLAPMLTPAYATARERAAAETGLGDDQLPADCPFSLEEVLSPAFLPEG